MLSHFIGDFAVIKIIDFLDTHQEFDYSKAEVTRYAGISKATLLNTWPAIEKMGLVKETRKVGNATLYKWNTGSPTAKTISLLSDQLDLMVLRKHAGQKQQLVATARTR